MQEICDPSMAVVNTRVHTKSVPNLPLGPIHILSNTHYHVGHQEIKRVQWTNIVENVRVIWKVAF